jgi:hypothetical protein
MHLRIRREDFIRCFRFPPQLVATIHARHPELLKHHLPLIEIALREYFLIHINAGYRDVAMPSRVVDELWRQFMLDTRGYRDFRKKAFGRTLLYARPVAMTDRYADNVRLRRTWWNACDLYDLDPKLPPRLPLLFAIDAKLNIADGYRYRLEDLAIDNARSNADAYAAGAISIAVMIDSSYDGTTDGLGAGDGGDGGGCGGD